jgi:Flp pilus assembly protein TadG
MLRTLAYRFVKDELGGGTIFSLLWFVLLVGICGLAVDITDGFRSRTMLQSTADSSALAGAIDLPVTSDVVLSAVDYSEQNMGTTGYGSVLMPEDITPGAWDHETRIFTPEAAVAPGTPLDAVHVMVHQGADNGNALATNFLRIIGLTSWNVKAQAIAQRFIPECLTDGLVAREIVDMSSNNGFVNRICVHGQMGVDMQSNNYFELGVSVSAPDLTLIDAENNNVGLEDAKREDILDPRMVDHVDEIIQGVLDKDPKVTPSYIDLNEAVIVTDNHFNFNNAIPGRIYLVQCQPMRNLVLPAGILMDRIALIADCQITLGANSTVTNSLIASRSGPTPGGNTNLNLGDANITAAAGVQLGVPDNCAAGGGVQLFSNATMNFSSTTSFDGVQLVAAGDISLGARDQGINGISAQSGGNIYMTSNNMFGLCSGGAPNLFTVDYYRLVL